MSEVLYLFAGQLVAHLHWRGNLGRHVSYQDFSGDGSRLMPWLQQINVINVLTFLRAHLPYPVVDYSYSSYSYS